MPKIIALTGPMAGGKNAAAGILEQRGFACIDADVLAHGIIDEKTPEILAAFLPLAREKGLELLEGGKINRRALGALLFGNPAALAVQESIVHPEVEKKTARFIAARAGTPVAINATVLYKTPALLRQCDSVLFINAFKIIRFFRIKRRDGLPARQILQRIHTQGAIFSQYKRFHADIYTVWNNGSLLSLEKKIDAFLAWGGEKGYGLWNKNESSG